jgi:hypothetical protein
MDNKHLDPAVNGNGSFRPILPSPPKKAKSKRLYFLLLCLILLIALLAGSAWEYSQYKGAKNDVTRLTAENKTITTDKKNLENELSKRKNTTGEENIDKSTYQSVFLSNSQTYFGKITKISDSQITLEDIYYLKSDNPNVELVKLGSELHGPQDKMYIERKEVQFWENLKTSSKVSQAIKQYQLQHPT